MPILVIAGPAGCGKSTIGLYIADALNLPFVEADTLHPAGNVDKMSRGIPLQDADRLPWLKTLHQHASELAIQGGCVMTCSALKKTYRAILQGDRHDVFFVFLQVQEQELERRMASRSGHFMKRDMIASQLADLELPHADEPSCCVVDAGGRLEATQAAVFAAIQTHLAVPGHA